MKELLEVSDGHRLALVQAVMLLHILVTGQLSRRHAIRGLCPRDLWLGNGQSQPIPDAARKNSHTGFSMRHSQKLHEIVDELFKAPDESLPSRAAVGTLHPESG